MKRSIAVLASLCLALAFLGTSAAGAAPRNGKILFRRYLNEDHTRGDIFSIRANGTRLFRVTHSGRNAVGTEPNPSPGGRWIAYMISPQNDSDRGRLYKIHPNGEGRTNLSRTCTHTCQGDGYPSWSPFGKRIAFQRVRSSDPSKPIGFSAIYVMRADGTHVRRVTLRAAEPGQAFTVGDQAPSWAPDGSHIAFERFSDARGHQAIFTVRLDGTHLRRITPWHLDASQPDYSPNGRWIAFRSHEESDTKGNIWLVRPNGDDGHPITHARAGRGKWQSCGFSPDGRFIVSARNRIIDGEQQNADVYVMRLDGSHRRNVTTTRPYWESAPDWGVGRA
jgi:TolB protein